MDSLRAFDITPPAGTPGTHSSLPDRHAADALAAAIRRPLEALESAAEEAEAGMLGAAKLGLLVATNDLIDALEAVDAEFARRAASRHADGPQPPGGSRGGDARGV
jgi:hypothetical protein